MTRHAVLDTSDKVINVIEIEPDSSYSPGGGTRVLFDARCINASPDDNWNGSAFVKPPNPDPPVDPQDVTTVKAYLTDAGLTAALGIADGSLTAAQRDYAIKNGIRALRALARIVRGIAT